MWNPKAKASKNLTLWVTHECNLHCPFCRDSANKKTTGFMSLDEVDATLKTAKERGIETILIGGGEPSLHPDIIEIAKRCRENGFFTVITTNYTKPDIIKALDGICNTINISLYEENKDMIPSQDDFEHSNIYLKVLLYKDRFKSKQEFDEFIDKYEKTIPNMGFSCMQGHSQWCKENKHIDWLGELEPELDEVIMMHRGNPCWMYRGHPIDRKDLLKHKTPHMMVDVRGVLFDEKGNWVLNKEEKGFKVD